VFVALVTATLAGCNSQPTHTGDPLIGDYVPKGPNGQPMPPPNPGQKTSYVVPPPPASNSATSVAALAGKTGLADGRPLAINEKSGPNWTLTNTNNGGNPLMPRSGGPTVQPLPRETATPSVPLVSAGAGNAGVVPASSWSTPGQPGLGLPQAQSVDELQKALQTRGAGGFTQETIPGGVRVSCLVPNSSNPNSLRFLETTGPDATTALRALLAQIDTQR